MLFGNTVKFTHMTLGLVPEVLNAIDVVGLVCKQFGMVDTEVFKVRYILHVIALPAVRIHDTIRHDFALDDGI